MLREKKKMKEKSLPETNPRARELHPGAFLLRRIQATSRVS